MSGKTSENPFARIGATLSKQWVLNTEAFGIDLSAFQKVQDNVKRLSTGITDVFKSIHDGMYAVSEMFPKLEAVADELAQRGWFLSGYFDLVALREVAALGDRGELDAAETFVSDYYQKQFESQIAFIIRDFPSREFILAPASAAHDRGDYALSILAFFSQADGIALEGFGKQIFFEGDKLRNEAKSKVEALSPNPDYAGLDRINIFERAIWRPIREKLPIAYGERQRISHGYTGLNRHTILHGEATVADATRQNSLKALSLLSFIASVAKRELTGP